ncbi:Dna polymerase [Thalictrum thalictroides]|uniref:DNA polymerase delta catalytic subunit n=1 Tax=Thalictrum thalictroides TaxID=46969 RepID=A0A7J6WVK8_THATH|nr:Dna polymerase [Thalictrum thalictroides]
MNNSHIKKRNLLSSIPNQSPSKRFQQQRKIDEEDEYIDDDVFWEEEEEKMVDEEVFWTKAMVLCDQEERKQAIASRLSIWRRPSVSPSYISQESNKNIIFQHLQIDHVICKTNKELLPNSTNDFAPIVRMFGVTEEGHSVCCNVHGFEPYFYVSCPLGMGPDDVPCLHKSLEARIQEQKRNKYSKIPQFVLRIEIVHKRSIMNFQEQEQQSHLLLKIVVALPKLVFECPGILQKGIHIDGIGTKMFMTCESNVEYALRFMIDCNIVGGNWIEVPVEKYKKATNPMSYCQLEFDSLYTELISHVPEGKFSKMAPFRILSFDIECAIRMELFPEPTHDPVIQVANLVILQGEDQPFIKNIMTLKSCSPIEGVDVMSFDTEREVLLSWREFVREVDPDIILGFNISNFDLRYLVERAEVLKLPEFPIFGRIRNSRVRVKDAHFLSRKFGKQKTKEIAVEGRVKLDVFQSIKRDYNLSSYTLSSVATHFLGEQKEGVHFSIITGLQNGNSETRRRLAVYCLKDAELSLKLLDKLMVINNYVEMARVIGVPISSLLSRGQKIKVLSQLLRKAKQKNLVIPSVKYQGLGDSTSDGAIVELSNILSEEGTEGRGVSAELKLQLDQWQF